MALNEAQKQLIINIDRRATEIIFNGKGNDHVLFQYVNNLVNDGELKEILENHQEEISTLYNRHNGFFLITELLKQLAVCSSKGIIPQDSIMSTAGDLVELAVPGSSQIMYADLEAVAKAGGFRAIKKQQSGLVNYSVSNIDCNDQTTAMNYLGQELSTTLFKTIHELPKPLRSPEMLLRGIEALLANLLNQKFNNAHQMLDDLCAHVHMALDDLKTRKH